MNRVALDLGVIQIYWYSICILVGMTLGMFLVYKETLKTMILTIDNRWFINIYVLLYILHPYINKIISNI